MRTFLFLSAKSNLSKLDVFGLRLIQEHLRLQSLMSCCFDTNSESSCQSNKNKEILELVGYDLDTTSEQASFGDASQSHIVPKVMLRSLSLETARQENVEALAYTLPEEYGIDGVIGLNFLRRFKQITLDFEQGVLTLENG